MKYDRNGALLASSIPGLPEPKRGKVRDLYDLGEHLLLVASDRISAFDCIMPNGIPDKGRVLNQLSLFWFDFFQGVPNHVVTADVGEYPSALRAVQDDLRGRSMLVRKVEIIQVECIARGYLVGSGWAEYKKTGTVHGMPLRAGYRQAEKLDQALFTPSVKAEQGLHDENISVEQLVNSVGPDLARALGDLTLQLYTGAADHAATCGVIIADTKFEFGRDRSGGLIVADEVLTPDSSRFWPADRYATGGNPPSLDKQFVRDWLDGIGFNHEPPAPELPDDIVAKTRDRYLQAYRQMTGRDL